MTEEMLLCPWPHCQGKVKIRESNGIQYWYICTKCKSQGPTRDTITEAIDDCYGDNCLIHKRKKAL